MFLSYLETDFDVLERQLRVCDAISRTMCNLHAAIWSNQSQLWIQTIWISFDWQLVVSDAVNEIKRYPAEHTLIFTYV